MLLSNHKDSDHDDESTSSDHKNLNDIEISTDDNNSKIGTFGRERAMSRNLIHGNHDDISSKEQKEIHQDMFSAMKQLKAHNEAMGFHAFSGVLEKHNDDQGQKKNNHVHFKDNKSIIMSETKGLRQKLENISLSINKIRKDLEERNNDKEHNKTIMYFQNQLTEIQDQIEDAENDIESNIDVKFIKYQEEIKVNKQKIKTMKKEQKEKEKKQQINKQKEQQKVIEQQRMQIEQLINNMNINNNNNNNNNNNIEPDDDDNNTNRHQYNDSTYFSLDFSKKNTSPKRRKSVPSQSQQQRSLLYDDNADFVTSQEEEDEEDDENEIGIEYINNHHPGYLIPNNSIPGYTPNTNNAHSPPTMIGYSPGHNHHYHNNTIYNEGGQYQYLQQQQQSQQSQRPLLSDNAIKIIGGVIIALSGVWIISKYFNNKSKRNNMPSVIRRAPRVKY